MTWLQRFMPWLAPTPDTTIYGDGRWVFTARRDGHDIVVEDVIATWFGGANDPEDNGETASGISTAKHPEIQGCALPMDLGPKLPSTQGSPIPRVPWWTQVEVVSRWTGRKIVVPVIDVGPSRASGHALDLTQAAFTALGGSLTTGRIRVDYRIVQG